MSRLIYLLFFLPFFTLSARDVVPFGIGIFPGILSPPGIKQSVTGLRISPLVGIHRDVYGVDVGVVNMAVGNTGATQLGIFNYQGKRMNVLGLQLGALVNWNAGHVSGLGLQMAGLLNKNTDNGYFFGMQVAPWNHSPKNNLYGTSLGLFNQNGYLRGLQMGIINRAADLGGLQVGAAVQSDKIWGIQSGFLLSQAGRVTGFQVGLFNMAEQVSGFQIGLINRAVSLQGIQIGLVNLHTNGEIPFFPLINIGI